MKDHSNVDEIKKAFKYPQIASDIFSSNSKQVIEFFSQKNSNGQLSNFLRLADEFIDGDKLRSEKINYTRAGYIQKIVNALITQKPMIFAEEFYQNPLLLKALFKHAYSKSLAGLIQTLIVSVQKNDQLEKDTELKKWVEDSQRKRQQIFSELIESILATADSQELHPIHENLYSIMYTILVQVFPERDALFEIGCKNFLDKIVEEFGNSFFGNLNNKIGELYSLFINKIIKQIKQPKNLPEILEKHGKKFFEIFNQFFESKIQPSVMTTTFSQELQTTNTKLINLIEIINTIVKELLEKKNFDFIGQSQLEKNLFKMFIHHPYNNIMHFSLNTLVQHIIDSKNEQLVDVFFTNNKAFDQILNKILDDYRDQNDLTVHQNNCYLGHIKNIFQAIQSYENVKAKTNNNTLWEAFYHDFYNIEQQKENKIFKEIDYNEPVDQTESYFEFSVQELQNYYSEFLQLSPGAADLGEEKNDSQTEDNSEEKSEEKQNEDEDKIDSQEFREELTLILNQEETAYQDLKYWKSNNYYDIDSLMNELNSQL